MKTIASTALILWVLHAAHVEAACKVGVRRPQPQGNICPDFEIQVSPDYESELIGSLEQCLLTRPMREIQLDSKPDSIQDSNCFLQAILRPEVIESIKRGAESYLALSRSERTSGRPDQANVYQLYDSLSAAVNSALPGFSKGSEDIFLLLGVLIERLYLFTGDRPGPVSRLEESGRRVGIYRRSALIDWVVFEYAAFVAKSKVLGAEARETLKASNRYVAPPDTYSAKECKKRISYNWPTISQPYEPYSGLPQDVNAHGAYVHVGICADDQSLWVYHYRVGWKRVSKSDIPQTCRGLSSYFVEPDPVVTACKEYR